MDGQGPLRRLAAFDRRLVDRAQQHWQHRGAQPCGAGSVTSQSPGTAQGNRRRTLWRPFTGRWLCRDPVTGEHQQLAGAPPRSTGSDPMDWGGRSPGRAASEQPLEAGGSCRWAVDLRMLARLCEGWSEANRCRASPSRAHRDDGPAERMDIRLRPMHRHGSRPAACRPSRSCPSPRDPAAPSHGPAPDDQDVRSSCRNRC